MNPADTPTTTTLSLIKRPARNEPVVGVLSMMLELAQSEPNASAVLVTLTIADRTHLVAAACPGNLAETLGQLELAKQALLEKLKP